MRLLSSLQPPILRDWHLRIWQSPCLLLGMKEPIFIKSGSAETKRSDPICLSFQQDGAYSVEPKGPGSQQECCTNQQQQMPALALLPLSALPFAVALIWQLGLLPTRCGEAGGGKERPGSVLRESSPSRPSNGTHLFGGSLAVSAAAGGGPLPCLHFFCLSHSSLPIHML